MNPLKLQSNEQYFDIWAQTYDTQLNPLVALEDRFLRELLPDIRGKRVLDVGCGTGRWLKYFAERGPADSLHGIDPSAAMLLSASQKNISGVSLLQCPCDATPFSVNTFDLIISSFVLSYVEDVHRMAKEIDRTAQNGCDFFLSDMHPETQHTLNWKRSFQSSRGKIKLDSARHGLADIVATFCSFGWNVRAMIEPEFGPPEREIFVAAGRLDYFIEANGFPAIYILHLRKGE
jgi:ubiquinone/menaquinone biosynthesis C-methylase UbiE